MKKENSTPMYENFIVVNDDEIIRIYSSSADFDDESVSHLAFIPVAGDEDDYEDYKIILNEQHPFFNTFLNMCEMSRGVTENILASVTVGYLEILTNEMEEKGQEHTDDLWAQFYHLFGFISGGLAGFSRETFNFSLN